jgi:type II secretory ATPase GspE/PulE/Tfp pilus assembly ATPase PilB-like protein
MDIRHGRTSDRRIEFHISSFAFFVLPMGCFMPDLLLASVEYSGYISEIKFAIFLALFLLWLPLVGWVYRDALTVETKAVFWTALVFGAGAAAAIIWLLIPLFVIGILFYLMAVGATSISYVVHRNARVMDFDRVLTAEHIKGLFVSKQKRLDALKGFLFVTANDNEVPLPQPQTPDFFGYKAAYDIFSDANWRRANSIMFSPTHEHYNVTYYVDGAPLKQPTIPRDQMEYFIRFLKNVADLDAGEKRKPQKGKFKIRQDKKNTEWEVATAGSTAGEQLRLKQIMQQKITRLTDIGLMPRQYEQLNKIRGLKQGLFIVTGPQKTGATTTFYALLRNHDAFINNICTLERRISAELPNITQNVFTLTDTGTTTYDKKLQAIVRMGPDIVGVADCENTETARVACAAAKDGKIVYVTLKADNVLRALGKWMKLVGDRNLATENLLGISSQRILRKLCDECKQAYGPNRELLKKLNIPAEKAKVFYRPGKLQYPKHGKPITCEDCQGTGFLGRTGVFETITINDELRDAIKQSKSLTEIGTQFRRAKMLYLQEQALRKVIGGITSVNEMVRILAASKKQKMKKPEQK